MKVLEKMRPIDHKLKYQIDKLVRTAVTGSLGKTCFLFPGGLVCQQLCKVRFVLVAAENDPLQLRPNPGNLISKVRMDVHSCRRLSNECLKRPNVLVLFETS